MLVRIVRICLLSKYALIDFEQWVGNFYPPPKWNISGFGIYAFAEIINKPGKRKSESDRSNAIGIATGGYLNRGN